MDRTWSRVAAAAVLTIAATSCAVFGGGKDHRSTENTVEASDVRVEDAAEDSETQLRSMVHRQLVAENANADERKEQVVRKKPYFFKEYASYADVDNIEVAIQERELQTSPYVADVSVGKQRFATRLHRKRVEAERDGNFIRDTGLETITYEMRGSRWVRVSSLFVASTSEEKVDGEWKPLDETSKRTVEAEEENARGWLGRTWDAISGK